jgi:hypothetical protein
MMAGFRTVDFCRTMSDLRAMWLAMGEVDISFRHLLRKLPRPLLRLAFPHQALEPLGPVDASVDRSRQLTTDNLFRVRADSGEVYVHVELEREWRDHLPARLFDYATAGISMVQAQVWTVAVLLRPGGRPPVGTGIYRIPGADGDAFVFRYHVVPLWQLDARSMRSQLGLEAAPFFVAMRGADEAFVRSLAYEVGMDRTMTRRARKTTTQLLFTVTAAILGADTARRIFHMDWLKDDPNVQEWLGWLRAEGVKIGRAEGRAKGVAEGRAKGVAEGRAKGVAEGMAKGRAEEARAALRRVLAARSFRVTAAVRARIDAEARIAQLESWLTTAVTASSIDDVFGDAATARSRRSRRRPAASTPRARRPRGRAPRSR